MVARYVPAIMMTRAVMKETVGVWRKIMRDRATPMKGASA